MRNGKLAGLVALLFALTLTAVGASAAIHGDYIEVRSADVYTGPCFANSQVGLEGNQAIMAWKVKQGSWHGVSLDGLSVVAVVKAHATLGDPYHDPYPAEAVMILDAGANAAQRAALQAMARANAGPLLDHVVRVDIAPIRLNIAGGMHDASAKLEAGKLALIETRALCSGDKICGNEVTYYPPLVKSVHAMPAYTVEDAFTGQGLGVVWQRMDRRSAFVGTFTN
jgi:hypothetical protein